MENSLRDHTIYYPTKSTGNTKIPVWINDACSKQDRSNQALLEQVASYGSLAITGGAPNGEGAANSQTMKTAIDRVP